MTVLSIDRPIPRRTKLERLGERAALDKNTVFNNLGHLIDRELLMKIYQQLDGKKAVGMDGVTKERFGLHLEENLNNLLSRIHKGTYRPQPSRLVEIPKEDGSKRPLAISCFEDKLVQTAVSQILTQIYEPQFLPCSYGFREGRSCHDALRALMRYTYPCWEGAVVEIDIKRYFNSIPHSVLKTILQKKITDTRFLRLIDKLTTAPIARQGKIETNTRGCPQGSIVSPILSNIVLHEVIDVWFEHIAQHHFKRIAKEVRYADDIVFIFDDPQEAKRFFEILPKRLEKYGLEMHTAKSRLIPSGQNVAAREHRKGKRLPVYEFLGFTIYWAKARNGKWWRMKMRSRRDRLATKLKGLKEFLRKHLTADTSIVLKQVVRVIRGWINYHAISDNEFRVKYFIHSSRYILKKWFNRRGRKRPMNWETFNNLMKKINFPNSWQTTSIFS